MVSIAAPLKDKRVGVIGFNARPIACSAKKAGATVFVSDYWGDDDLSACCDNWIAVLTPTPGARQRQPLDMPLPVALVDNLLHLTKERQLDYVLIGSGFDDHTEAIEPLENMGLLVGCSTAQIAKARDFQSLKKLAEELDLKFPKRNRYETPTEISENSAAIDFPCVVRPIHSGGGSGIRLARRLEDILAVYPNLEEKDKIEPRVIQEYIQGVDVSCSVLSTGDLALSLSVQGQLIGMPTAGRNCDFAYCGNYLPNNLSSNIETKIMEVSEIISTNFKLKGSVGLDFVVDDQDQIWLMEVNPRIQGSLELVELAGNVSLTELHMRATIGVLPVERPKMKPGVKMVVYSRSDGSVLDLNKFPNTVDRTPPGVKVNLGDPICTV
ncbi:MAG: ATP-grasp domain-containing protein, partial [Candidatus Thorarchaeota archaeon]